MKGELLVSLCICCFVQLQAFKFICKFGQWLVHHARACPQAIFLAE